MNKEEIEEVISVLWTPASNPTGSFNKSLLSSFARPLFSKKIMKFLVLVDCEVIFLFLFTFIVNLCNLFYATFICFATFIFFLILIIVLYNHRTDNWIIFELLILNYLIQTIRFLINFSPYLL